jgi:CheY-like chemotaxis protein
MKSKRPKAPLNILLADDDTDDRYFFEKALSGLSIATELKTVPDGERLMNYLHENSAHLPDVLFLDNNMPRKNGSECLLEIKCNAKLKQIPVILCSTSLGADFANTLYQNGAHYYLHKCDFSELTQSIEMILNLLAANPAQPPRDKFMLRLQEA